MGRRLRNKLIKDILIGIVAFAICFMAFPSLREEFSSGLKNVDSQIASAKADNDISMPVGSTFDLSAIPEWDGSKTYVTLNDNKVSDDISSITTEASEYYGDLDALGRCTDTYAVVSTDTMPTAERGSIGMVKPSGWHTVRYDDLIPDGKYLYNRCHLIGYQLTGQNANYKNLITGTRFMNVQGMEPFENEIAQYVKSTGQHVFYHVTPIFDGDDLVAKGVHMQAFSIEDGGAGLQFNIYCYNNQPGIVINYTTGDSTAA